MLYKNAFKLVMSNTKLVWKVLLFLLINSIVIIGLLYVFSLPIIEVLSDHNWFGELQSIYYSFLNNMSIADFVNQISGAIKDFVDIIVANSDTLLVNIIFFIFTLFFVNTFLNGFYGLVIANIMYNYMSNKIKYGFMASFIETFYKNIKYNLLNIVTKLPIDIAIYAIVIMAFELFSLGGAYAFFAPFIIVLAFIVLRALKLTYFTSWAPAIIIFDKTIAKDIDKGLLVTRRKLKRVFSESLYVILTVFALNVFVGFATFGVGLIITIPFSIVLVSCFNMVVFYSSYGMRYYVDETNVIVPKKLEQTDELSSVKYVI